MKDHAPPNSLLEEQLAYYRERASEYEDWFYRRGRYALDDDLRRQWFEEVEHLDRELAKLAPRRAVLELAGGTGIWTKKLALMAEGVTVLDGSPEMIALNRAAVAQPHVEYRQQDLFSWRPNETYDLVFASFWLSHVPPEKLSTFLTAAREATSPEGRVFFIDGLYNPKSTASDHHLEDRENIVRVRKLDDGRSFRIVKVFYEPHVLRAKLAAAGFEASVQTTGEFFWYAVGRPQ